MRCGDYLAHPAMKVVERDDTAGSAREIAETAAPRHGRHLRRRGGGLYRLEILERGIETNKHNFTRFLLLADRSRTAVHRPGAHEQRHRWSSAAPRPGSLSKVLTLLSFYEINLSKIRSLPIIGREWESLHVDVTFDDPVRYRQAIEAARPLTSDFRILGEYAECPQPGNLTRNKR